MQLTAKASKSTKNTRLVTRAIQLLLEPVISLKGANEKQLQKRYVWHEGWMLLRLSTVAGVDSSRPSKGLKSASVSNACTETTHTARHNAPARMAIPWSLHRS
eukprot:5712813-Amphidinium_carterae.1